MLRRVGVLLGIVGLHLAVAAGATSAHNVDLDVGGTCPHASASYHGSGWYAVTVAAEFGGSDSICIASRVRVYGWNVLGGDPVSGWGRRVHGGDPGVVAAGSAVVIWKTEHQVWMNFGPYSNWYGLTILHPY